MRKQTFVVAVHCGSFGEPNNTVDFWINGDDGTESSWSLTPADTISFAETMIARAKQARAMSKRWERQHVDGISPLIESELDSEDRGADIGRSVV